MSLPMVRPFRLPDAEAVAALILSIQRQEFGLPVTLADQPDLQAIPSFYQTDCGGFWVAEARGTIGLRDFRGRRPAGGGVSASWELPPRRRLALWLRRPAGSA